MLTWGPLSSGKLTGKHSGQSSGDTKRHWWDHLTERETTIVGEVVSIAEEIGRTPSQVAINWIRQQQHRALIIPVLGARTADQIKDNLGCLDFRLSDDQLQRLDRVSRMEFGFPHDFLASDMAKSLVHGGMLDQIDK